MKNLKKLKDILLNLILLKKISLFKKIILFVFSLIICAGVTVFVSQKMNSDLELLLKSSERSFLATTNFQYVSSVNRALQQIKGRTNLYLEFIENDGTLDGDEFELDLGELDDAILELIGQSMAMKLSEAELLDTYWTETKMILDLALEEIYNEDNEKTKKHLNSFLNRMDPLEEKLNNVAEKNSAISQAAYKQTFLVKGGSVYFIYAIALMIVIVSGIGSLFFFKLASTLKNLMEVMEESNENLLGESQSLTEVSSSLSSAVALQQESITESVSAIEEITAMNKKTNDIALKTNTDALTVKDIGEGGKKEFNQVLTSMNDIHKANLNITKEMESNAVEMSKINDIIKSIADKTKVINDIVFQTKLLSFNASVEAARAGEQGKGFSVVAEEIGALASMSGKAANEISALLSESTKTVEDTIKNSKTRVNSILQDVDVVVQNGVKTSEVCSVSMNDIVEKISGLSVSMNEVSTASSEQSKGVEDVGVGLKQIDSTSHETVLASQGVKKSSHNLEQRALEFSKVIEKLKDVIEGQKDNGDEYQLSSHEENQNTDAFVEDEKIAS